VLCFQKRDTHHIRFSCLNGKTLTARPSCFCLRLLCACFFPAEYQVRISLVYQSVTQSQWSWQQWRPYLFPPHSSSVWFLLLFPSALMRYRFQMDSRRGLFVFNQIPGFSFVRNLSYSVEAIIDSNVDSRLSYLRGHIITFFLNFKKERGLKWAFIKIRHPIWLI